MIELNLTSLIQLLNFLVLLFVLKKLLFDKFFDVIEERQKMIKSELSEAEKLRKEAEAYREKYRIEMENARKKSQEIITNAERQAEEIIKTAKENAQREAIRIMEAAEAQIAQEKENALKQLQATVITTAVEIAAKFLGKEMDEAMKRQYAQGILKSLGDEE